ncbi:MAG: hypothetical protein VB140_06645 [Burkholderia sp.]|nr:MAG: hypothetical protein E5299_02399 [Burkholderia gladioli]
MERIADELVGNPFISPEIIDPKFVINMPVDAITSLRSIYATTPPCSVSVKPHRFRINSRTACRAHNANDIFNCSGI